MRYTVCLVALLALLWGATPLFSAPSGMETAQKLLAAEQISEALHAVQEHLQHHPDDPQGRFLNGLILERLGRFTEAMDMYRDLIRSHPEFPEPYNNLAGLLAADGRHDEAKDILQRALETHPSYATAHRNLSRIYAAMASSAYRRVLGKDDQRVLVRLDPLDELAGATDDVLPATGMHVAATSQNVEPRTTPDPSGRMGVELVPGSDSEPARESAVAPDRQRTTAPVPESRIEPLPEHVASQPDCPEPVTVPAPDVVPAPVPPVRHHVASPGGQQDPEATESLPITEDARERITSTVQSWAKAWANQDVEAYLSFYSGSFQPERGLTLAQWRAQRRTRVAAPSFIHVSLSNIEVTIQGENAALARFDQHYRSNIINDRVLKELHLRKESGTWQIIRERLLPRP